MIRIISFRDSAKKHSAMIEITQGMDMGHFRPMLCIRGVGEFKVKPKDQV